MTTKLHTDSRKILLLDGIHASAIALLRSAGYSDITAHAEALSGQALP